MRLCTLAVAWIFSMLLKPVTGLFYAPEKCNEIPSNQKRKNYDAIVDFGESMSGMIESKQLKVELGNENPSFDLMKAGFGIGEGWRSVGVLGLFDKGKTFVLNRLFCMDLPSGKRNTTKGLSLVYDGQMHETGNLTQSWLVIDSAGFQATVNFSGNYGNLSPEDRRRKEKELISEQILYETFIFGLVSQLAHWALFIVNDLTWMEQKLIYEVQEKQQLVQQLQDSKQDRNEAIEAKDKNKKGKKWPIKNQNVAVLHNFRTVKLEKVARHLFEQQVELKHAGNKNLEGKEFQYNQWGRPLDQKDGETAEAAGKNKVRQKTVTHYAIFDYDSPFGKAKNDGYLKEIKENMRAKTGTTEDEYLFIHALTKCLQRSLDRILLLEKYTPTGTIAIPTAETKVTYDDESKTIYISTSEPDVRMKLIMDGDLGSSTGAFGQMEPSVYSIPGYGRYEKLLIFQVEAPGVEFEDIDIKNVEGTYALTFTRKETIKLPGEAKNISLPKGVGGGVYKYRKLPFTGTTQGRFEFDNRKWKWTPRQACLDDWKFQEPRQKECAPVRLENGILFITARQRFDSNSVGLGSMRRRRHMVDL